MRTTVIIIGAGHAGLAMSRCLTEHAIDHVVFERGEVANSWKTERWDSLQLLTPNWMSRLAGYRYQGNDPDGYRTMPETIAFLERYAEVSAAPVQTHTAVTSVRRCDDGYAVVTNRGDWHCRAIVLATGACNIASVPAFAEAMPPTVATLTSMAYRHPGQLEEGGVLVVGASASGIQIADEIHRSGRPVTLSVGEHVRAPRLYRGRDIQWCMDVAGIFDERYDDLENLARARRLPSIQLVGSATRRTLDLNALTDLGVKLVGRMAGISGGKAQFSGSLLNVCTLADLKMHRLLDTIDAWATTNGFDGEVDPPHRFPSTQVDGTPPQGHDLKRCVKPPRIRATG
jgi:putative flavoprotein involved in K+ transport